MRNFVRRTLNASLWPERLDDIIIGAFLVGVGVLIVSTAAYGWLVADPSYDHDLGFAIVALAFGLLLTGGWCLARARRWAERRRKDRISAGLCPRCAYPFKQVPSDRCPECGYWLVTRRLHHKP
jgi:uncharacterized paraquat-inducible protein A